MKAQIGDIIHFTLKQKKPYSSKGTVKLVYVNYRGVMVYEIAEIDLVIFEDEITNVEKP